ncbi:hypothetical protein PFICI_05860 [Pestalotiopsis fici W106-1]|uniref:Uncharacterized protein n=1 Tax=Pestalotiopsis fici (strain W106-1 / CGMCC3.15140) TaxID=1229662 RepID=W3XD94_PESFW|nr:uncharacterized protein PFICI_05860 [Pestalotiopsis fici W106-1]ETS83984.1 hypothetical protein PFICI_05860 [Pestalotiopsis fici W106-1]
MGTVQDHSDLVDLSSTTVLPAIVESPPSRTPSPSSSNTTIESRGRGSLVAGIDAARLRTALSTASTVTSQRRDAPISTTLRSSRGGESYDSYEESASQISDPSTSDDIGSHASGEVLMEMKRHWETLSTQRLEIRRLLDDLRRARTHMRALAQAKDDADRKLELALRSDHFNTDRDTLEPYLIAIRTSKLKYQAAETTVDQLIDNVDDAIFEADIIEGRFYNRLSRRNLEADIPGPVNESQGKHQVPSRMSLRGISPDRSEDLHPSYERLREVYGDLQLAKEYCSNLGYKHTVVQSEDHDLLGPDELEFLDDFEDSLAKAKSDVQTWSQKFEELRAECAAKNLIPKSSPFFEDGRDGDYHEPHVFVPDDISLDDCLVDESTLSHSQYSLLVTNPKHVLNKPLPLTSQGALEQALMLPLNTSGRNQAIQEAMHEHSIATLLHDAIPEDKTDYINRWLLQKLRISPMEVQVLSLTFRKILKILDYNRWQRDVLSFWPRDIDRQPVQGDITITTHIRHEFETLSNPSDKREESRSQARSQAASEPLLRPADIYDDWEYLNNLRDDGQSEGAL